MQIKRKLIQGKTDKDTDRQNCKVTTDKNANIQTDKVMKER